jgi:hypothetical protein
LREQFYIDFLEPEYNLYKIASSPLDYNHTEESKVLMSFVQKSINRTGENNLMYGKTGEKNPMFGRIG